MDLAVIFVFHGERALEDHIACVKTFCHRHNGDTHFALTCHDGALNGRGTSVCGEQGCVDVDAAVFRVVENVFRQNFAVCRNDDDVGGKLFQRFAEVFFFQVHGLINGKTQLHCRHLDRRRCQRMTAVFRHIDARNDANNRAEMFLYLFKGNCRKFGRAHI